MAEDERRHVVGNKTRDINANGLQLELSQGLPLSSVPKREALDTHPLESGNGRMPRWPPNGREIIQTTTATTSNPFLPSIGHSINNQQAYFYRGDPRLAQTSGGSLRFNGPPVSDPLKSHGVNSPLDVQTGDEAHHRADILPPHSTAISSASSNPQFHVSHSREDMAVHQHHESLSEDSAADTSAASPPASVECVVCGDKSSGKHYGQYTCEGCKSFFKRSVRRNLSYTCRGSRTCPVDLQHRNQCQYCRFQKCIKLGMRREAVQKGRVPPNNMLMYPNHLGCSITTWPSQDGGGHHPIHGVALLSNYSIAPFISTLVKADELFQPSRFSNVARPDNMNDQSSHLMIGIIEWAKKIPHFSDTPLPDQVALLKNCWHELFLITAIQVAMPVPVAQMVSACLTPDTDRVAVMGQLVDHSRILQSQLEKLKKLLLDVAEYASLKAIILFNPDTIGIGNTSQVESIQEKVQIALEEYSRITYPNQGSRFGRILLRLPTLSKASSQIIEQLILMRLVNRDSVESLIQNLLLRGANLSPNSVPTLHHGLATFSSTNAIHTNLNGVPVLQSNSGGGGATVMTPQLPSPCLPVSTPLPNAPMHHSATSVPPVTTHSHHLHPNGGGNGLWLPSSCGVDGSAMGPPLVATGESGNSALLAHHQNM